MWSYWCLITVVSKAFHAVLSEAKCLWLALRHRGRASAVHQQTKSISPEQNLSIEEWNYVQSSKVWSVFEQILFCLFSWSKSKSKKSSQRPNQDLRNSYQKLWLQNHLLHKKVLRWLQTNLSLMTPYLSQKKKSFRDWNWLFTPGSNHDTQLLNNAINMPRPQSIEHFLE